MGSENAPEFVQKIQFSIEYKNELNVVGDLQNLITTDFEITSLSTSEVRNTFKTSQKIKILVRILMIFQSRKRLYNHKCLLVCLSVIKTPQQLEIIIKSHQATSSVIKYPQASLSNIKLLDFWTQILTLLWLTSWKA